LIDPSASGQEPTPVYQHVEPSSSRNGVTNDTPGVPSKLFPGLISSWAKS